MKRMTGETYSSKIMLVGEYGVVLGGSALTIPFTKFHARVRHTSDIPGGKEQEAAQSLQYLKALYTYIRDLPAPLFHAKPDLELFSAELENYWLEMTIPTGYGLGSSGAVSAAIYDLFFTGSRMKTVLQQKEDLAQIESYFHGKSSGVDALTCYKGSPLYFREDGNIEGANFNPLEIPLGYRFFLLDSGERYDTGPLVKHFLSQMEDPEFESSIRSEYLVINQKLIEALLGFQDVDPGLLFRVLSDYQLKHFREMIPPAMTEPWIEGQVSNEFYLKLSGSGGGFLLGFTHHTMVESLEERWRQKLIWIQ